MTESQTPAQGVGRRRFLARLIAAVHGAIGATLTFILGGPALAPAFQRRRTAWLHAGSIDSLRDNEPLAVTLRIARQDGYAQVVDRTVIYLVKVGEGEVRALSSTCTHLGCRTSYDPETRRIACPCHGGAYDVQGNVIAGPPPAPLAALETRIEGDQILVEL
jgi:Rieske Fe-S protein